eukprot:6472922-Prymnesium_polylepis.1
MRTVATTAEGCRARAQRTQHERRTMPACGGRGTARARSEGCRVRNGDLLVHQRGDTTVARAATTRRNNAPQQRARARARGGRRRGSSVGLGRS